MQGSAPVLAQTATKQARKSTKSWPYQQSKILPKIHNQPFPSQTSEQRWAASICPQGGALSKRVKRPFTRPLLQCQRCSNHSYHITALGFFHCHCLCCSHTRFLVVSRERVRIEGKGNRERNSATTLAVHRWWMMKGGCMNMATCLHHSLTTGVTTPWIG